MSQEGGSFTVCAEAIRNAIPNMVDREKNMLANLDAVANSIMTAADYLSILKDGSQVAAYKEVMLSLGKLSHEMRAQQSVLQGIRDSYQPSLESTNFEALLEQHLRVSLQHAPYQPQNDARLKEFMIGVAGEGGGTGEGDGDGNEGLEDDEVREADTGRSWANEKCPLCMREVLELEHPVKDAVGYVYEKASILNYLQGHPNGRKHPVAGVNQIIRTGDLKRADDVLRMKRRRRLQEALGENGGDDEHEEEYIDV